jgi:hypothetical protein
LEGVEDRATRRSFLPTATARTKSAFARGQSSGCGFVQSRHDQAMMDELRKLLELIDINNINIRAR